MSILFQLKENYYELDEKIVCSTEDIIHVLKICNELINPILDLDLWIWNNGFLEEVLSNPEELEIRNVVNEIKAQ